MDDAGRICMLIVDNVVESRFSSDLIPLEIRKGVLSA
jgi:hypothetical protein